VESTEEILFKCIEDIKTGKTTLAECLVRYADVRDELEPLLRIALNIAENPDIRPSEEFKAKARASLMEYIQSRQSPKKNHAPKPSTKLKFSWFSGRAKAATIALAVVVVLAVSGGGTAYAAQSSLPGEILYNVKLGTEQLQRVFTFDSVAQVELELKFAGKRLEEIEKLTSLTTAQAAASGTANISSSVPGEDEKSIIAQEESFARAVAAYEKNLNNAVAKSTGLKDNEQLLETIAITLIQHLNRLDEIENKAPGQVIKIIAQSENTVIDEHINVVQELALVNPARASEVNQQVIENRQKKAEAELANKNNEKSEGIFEELEKLRRLGEEIENTTGNIVPEPESPAGNSNSSAATDNPGQKEKPDNPANTHKDEPPGNSGEISPSPVKETQKQDKPPQTEKDNSSNEMQTVEPEDKGKTEAEQGGKPTKPPKNPQPKPTPGKKDPGKK